MSRWSSFRRSRTRHVVRKSPYVCRRARKGLIDACFSRGWMLQHLRRRAGGKLRFNKVNAGQFAQLELRIAEVEQTIYAANVFRARLAEQHHQGQAKYETVIAQTVECKRQPGKMHTQTFIFQVATRNGKAQGNDLGSRSLPVTSLSAKS